jgi:hypothetical protein
MPVGAPQPQPQQGGAGGARRAKCRSASMIDQRIRYTCLVCDQSRNARRCERRRAVAMPDQREPHTWHGHWCGVETLDQAYGQDNSARSAVYGTIAITKHPVLVEIGRGCNSQDKYVVCCLVLSGGCDLSALTRLYCDHRPRAQHGIGAITRK